MKKVLLVADCKGWAFDHHCQEIKKRSKNFDCDIAYVKHDNIFEKSKDYDIVYVLDPMPFKYPPKEKVIMGLRCEFLYQDHPEGAIGLYEKGFPGKCVDIKDRCSVFHVLTDRQYNVFKDIVLDKPFFKCPHGVNLDLFKMKGRPLNKMFKVGMAGRPGSLGNKGFDEVAKVCLEMGIELVTAHYGRNKVPFEQMPDFYSKLNAYVCFSESEGLQNPLLEAGAMGVPLISTRVGGAEEIIKHGENGILIDRSEISLKNALYEIRHSWVNQKMSQEIHEEIVNNWGWEKAIEKYEEMFGII